VIDVGAFFALVVLPFVLLWALDRARGDPR
jgi:hypothetical protein